MASPSSPSAAARRRPAMHVAMRLLQATHTIGPAFRLFERWQTFRSMRARAHEPETGPDGLPLPPQRLIVSVAGPTSTRSFLEKGKLGADIVRDALARQGVEISGVADVLDFGVGCGRVARHWQPVEGPRFHGCDINAESIAWTQANLPFVDAFVSPLAPPLPCEPAGQDVVYALSVFTHLSEDLQDAWSAELARMLRPGGHLVISTHGDAYLDRLDAAERRRYKAGERIVHFGELAGANLCAAFHSPDAVRAQFAEGFELVESIPSGAASNGRQDLHVLRRR